MENASSYQNGKVSCSKLQNDSSSIFSLEATALTLRARKSQITKWENEGKTMLITTMYLNAMIIINLSLTLLPITALYSTGSWLV